MVSNQYANLKAVELIKQILEIPNARHYSVPHSNFTRDMFGMWDVIMEYDNGFVFIALTKYEQLKQNIERHGLLDINNYYHHDGVTYVIACWKRVKNHIQISIYQLIPDFNKQVVYMCQEYPSIVG